ncbi:hypothetical protein [Arenicella xantha]|uniref:Lipoprotein n=1 Tax=Arenicella xantha TaxID=644221 RepID=A0A395JSZ3_9GAMM|nr:hypothetical protein [Arenicella xantha]RBP53665.1 hypothetical protein DFR28_1011052 [Arenicella xantha]
MTARPILLAAALLLGACSDAPSPHDLSEEAEYFEVSDNSNNTVPVAISLRPIKLDLEIPRHHLASIAHPYKPWAKTIWDRVNLQVLLPDFQFRNTQNLAEFNSQDSADVLRYRIGGLSSDQSFVLLSVNKEYQEVDDFADVHLRAYVNRRKYGNQSEESIQARQPTMFVVNESYLRTPSEKPIVLSCNLRRCNASMVIPASNWPEADRVDFGGTQGVRIEFNYDQKYLRQWQQIHNFVLATIASYIHYPESVL